MRRYESTVIIDPDISAENRIPLLEKIKDLIPQKNGFLVKLDEWGNQKLAYEIMKKTRGYYIRLDYCGTGLLVSEMERFFRIDDRVLKFMTILLDKNADLDKIKEDMAKAAAEAASTAQTGKPEESAVPSKESEQEGTNTEKESNEKE
ncbi:MAG: 30S ribosomal protein S6 [Desulfobacteraceae bacterium]|nr:MAG: 30S ribosomal protein S6 [Desulfobacteraceae bacterium]